MEITKIKATALFLLLSIVLVYVSMMTLLAQGWLKGDDFLFVCEEPFCFTNLIKAIHWYLNLNARFGEFFGRLLGLAANRWQHWVFSPLILVAMPFVMLRLLSRKNTISYGKKVVFFWFVSFLILQSADLTSAGWRPFWCYAACVNYFWCSLITLGFMSLMVPIRWSDLPTEGWRLKLCSLFLFCMGCCSGWSSEAITVVCLPLMLCGMVWCIKARVHIPIPCRFGVAGMCFGAFMLFGSPGMYRRAAGEALTRSFDVSSVPYTELVEWVQSLTQEKVQMLVGSSGVVNLADIPMWLHVYFLPYLAKVYWTCCWFPTVILVILMTMMFFRKPDGWRRGLVVAAGLYALSWLCACSYLGGAIPSQMSFLPPSLIIVVACAYLFLQMRGTGVRYRLICLTMFIVCLGVVRIAPSGVEAWKYKKFEKQRFEEIARQKMEGRTIVELPPVAWDLPPVDSLGIIRRMDLGENPDKYPNSCARHFYGVEGILQRKSPEERK